jgi:group II intron reverse transcriptase/maturase
MERVVERGNLQAALQRVRQNKGSPGVDGMAVDELTTWLVANWKGIRKQLLAGTYQPMPVREQEIPKSGGGVRKLGIPTVLDRFIQQAILQVLQPMLDPTFSQHSYGFRPGRSAHQAVCAAQRYIQAGYRVVVDVDLEKFFDRVNHDVLMGRLEKRIGDKRLLGLIRRYLEAGIMANGVVMERHEGTPQGGPLSPLLANVLLDEVDKELERRGHRFARYADDSNVYVRSERAGHRVMALLRRLYAGLHLRINEAKSTVARPEDRQFLGFSFREVEGETLRVVSPKAVKALKERVRVITDRMRGRSMTQIFDELKSYLRGWRQYFQLAQVKQTLSSLDGWIRRRLRMVQLKQWKNTPRAYQELRRLGRNHEQALIGSAHLRSWWRNACNPSIHAALPTRYYDERGIPRLAT